MKFVLSILFLSSGLLWAGQTATVFVTLPNGDWHRERPKTTSLSSVFSLYVGPQGRMYLEARFKYPLEEGNPAGYSFEERLYFGQDGVFDSYYTLDQIKDAGDQIEVPEEAVKIFLNGKKYTYGGKQIVVSGEGLEKIKTAPFLFEESDGIITLRNLAQPFGYTLNELQEIFYHARFDSPMALAEGSHTEVRRRNILDLSELLREKERLKRYKNVDTLAERLIINTRYRDQTEALKLDEIIKNFLISGARLKDEFKEPKDARALSRQCLVSRKKGFYFGSRWCLHCLALQVLL